ncbi:MAG: hypothetical protein A2V70_10995, partial [Planctomycetes bacterium RBG_13_63_9]
DKSVPLKNLLRGQSACVSRITGEPDHVHRMEEFGLCGGRRIQMFRPGNPCIFRIAGSKVCCRTDDLLSIFVEPDSVVSGSVVSDIVPDNVSD